MEKKKHEESLNKLMETVKIKQNNIMNEFSRENN